MRVSKNETKNSVIEYIQKKFLLESQNFNYSYRKTPFTFFEAVCIRYYTKNLMMPKSISNRLKFHYDVCTGTKCMEIDFSIFLIFYGIRFKPLISGIKNWVLW